MRIDHNSVIGGYPALKTRELLLELNNTLCWDAATVQRLLRTDSEAAAGLLAPFAVRTVLL